MGKLIEIKGLSVTVEKRKVISSLDMSISSGEVHALMGPNGSGKSSLALGLMGHPSYEVSGKVKYMGQDLLSMSPDKRAREGILLAFQSPVSVPGVTVFNFLRESYQAIHGSDKHESVKEFKDRVVEILLSLGLSEEFLKRYVNDGFSGGERKKMEVLQAILLEPRFIILDEIDSGLDVDSLKLVASTVRDMVSSRELAVLVISHYKRLLDYLTPDRVHIISGGKIVEKGDSSLISRIEEEGYGPQDNI